jgi:hypothetical protein
MSRWRAARGPAIVALLAAIFVWNLVFDLWLGQAERQYLWKKAGHALGESRDVTLDGSMAVAVREGAVVATAWTAAIVGAIALAAWLGFRAGRDASRVNAKYPTSKT